MKTARLSKIKKTMKFVRIDAYTWIEKKIDEPDEVTRQKFLMKLSGSLTGLNLQPIN